MVVKNFALSPIFIFLVVIAPPAPAVTILFPLKEKTPISPKLPFGLQVAASQITKGTKEFQGSGLSSDSCSQSQNLCRHSPVAIPELSPELKTLPS